MNRRLRTRHGAVTLTLFVVGLGLLIPFDAPVTLALGVFALLAFVASGVSLIAEPGFLAGDD